MEIFGDSPAERADLKPGDVIQKIDEKEVKDMGDILRILYEFKPGDKSNIEFIRNGQKQNVEITYMEKPNNYQ